MEMYCLKCKKKTDTRDPAPIRMKNGREATIGLCTVCGTRKYRIGKVPATV